MSADDKFAIHEAIAKYFFALDKLTSADELADAYTEDAVWECFNHGEMSPALRFASRAEMEQAVAFEAARTDAPLLRHHACGIVFEELSADRARTKTKVLVTMQVMGDPAPRVRNTATCYGTWRKTDRGWKLARWVIHRDPAA